MSEPSVLYCVGATKAGTSWLHNYLSAHPQTHFRHVKELHYWDKAAPEARERFIDVLLRQRRNAENQFNSAKRAGKDRVMENQQRRMGDLDDLIALHRSAPDHPAYLAYMSKGAGDARLIGDMTPAYSLCSEEVLAQMQQATPKGRFIYILRDPVARLWSHVRMMADRRAAQKSEVPARTHRIFDRVLDGKEVEISARSDYAGALARLTHSIDPKRLLILFYETLFSQETIDRICNFLGLDPQPADFERKVLVSSGVRMDDAQRARAALFLAPQYAATTHFLGNVPAQWDRHLGMGT